MNDSGVVREGLAALSKFFVGENSLEQTLQRVIELTQTTLPSVDMVAITMLNGDAEPSTTVFTDEVAAQIDQAQYDAGSGPCLEAFRDCTAIRIESMIDDGRWPLFAAAALHNGVLSTLSMPLVASGRSVGAMNLYSRNAHAFTAEDERIAATFAEHAAIPLANAQAYWEAFEMSANLNEAMNSRATIEQAKGIIMSLAKVSADKAFEMLRETSQAQQCKVRDLAIEIVLRNGGEGGTNATEELWQSLTLERPVS